MMEKKTNYFLPLFPIKQAPVSDVCFDFKLQKKNDSSGIKR